MAYSRFRVRVDDERVRDLDPPRHLLLNPEGPSGADGRPAMLLDTWTGAAARRAVGNALQIKTRAKEKKNDWFLIRPGKSAGRESGFSSLRA